MVPVQNAIRTNLTITDKHGLTVNLNEAGPDARRKRRWRAWRRRCARRWTGASWLMLCGSLPPGVPPSFYGKLIALARQKKVKTLLHADGDALREGIEERPTVATPNQQEAERLLGRTLLTRTHYLEAADADPRRWGRNRWCSRWAAAARWARSRMDCWKRCRRAWTRCAPSARAMRCRRLIPGRWSAQGQPGRSAALGRGRRHGFRRLPGMNFATLHQTEEIYRQVEVRRVE